MYIAIYTCIYYTCVHIHTYVQSMGFSPKDSKAALDEHGSVAAAVEAMVYKTGIYMYIVHVHVCVYIYNHVHCM